MTQLKPTDPTVEVHSDHAVIRPPNTLRAKALTVVNDPNYDQAADIERADRAVETLAPSFEEWLINDIEKLRGALAVFIASPKDEAAVRRFYLSAHDLHGSTMQLGYPLAGHIAGELCKLLEAWEQSPIPANILEQYVDAIVSIVRGRVQNESDVLAREIVRALAHLSAAFRRETPHR
jgi:hypothetical protein